MKKISSIVLLTICVGTTGLVAQSKKQLKAELETTKQKLASLEKLSIPKQDLTSRKDSFSYSIGADLYINNLVVQNLDTAISADAFYLGFKAAEMDKVSIEPADREAIIQSVFEIINARKQALAEVEEGQKSNVANENLAKGNAYLTENGKKKDVVTLPSGLQYKVLSSGDKKTASPTATSSVTVNYEGKLIDGNIFDSSYQRGTPATFPVNGVIKGWTDILQIMHKGDKWEVAIPSELAYGQGGNRSIAPNETLIFIIELLEVN